MNSGNSSERRIVRRSINITVVLQGERITVTTHQGEYRNLMALLYDKFYVDGFGECKGMGRCGTCQIHLPGNSPGLLTRMGNENTTLAKTSRANEGSRLACQIFICDELDGEVVEVLTDYE